MAFNPKFQLYSDRDMDRIFQLLPMSTSDRRVFSEDYAQVKRSQLDTSEILVSLDQRLDVAEVELVVLDGRIDVVEAEIVVIKQRLDDVEAAAYMAVLT